LKLADVRDAVRVGCANPARLYGLYPRKGTLRVGSDADVVLWDLRTRGELTKRDLHDELDYTP
jgi:dihydropyrimidinase